MELFRPRKVHLRQLYWSSHRGYRPELPPWGMTCSRSLTFRSQTSVSFTAATHSLGFEQILLQGRLLSVFLVVWLVSAWYTCFVPRHKDGTVGNI